MQMLKRKIKGSTIVEVLIALAITSFALVLASLIYLQVQKSTTPFFKVKAIELAEYYMKATLNERALIDESFQKEEFTIKRIVTPSSLFGDCQIIRIIVFNRTNKKIHELGTVVYTGR